ncbi:uncharacterized protein BXZ73DRAFT_77854 [Epithele typhae]|uniref:uncharacterized protein n=1 Tax=Epithele typhae TaxID=378194 RepID=UPI0020072E7A|nr:uncharacterized protein BXZ73DRAFT_77854 [Epithele typhae]KAH9930400.1 hypothetical protein BXZ73DRAFT_77854 [Epithele typhae]
MRAWGSFLSPLCSAASLLAAVHAQQYQGTPSANTLPPVDGATVEFFRINDTLGRNSTLINYFSLDSDHDRSKVTRALLINTAFDGRPDIHFRAARDARNLATLNNSAVQRETAAILVPLWFDPGDNVQGDALVWTEGANYSTGDDNLHPADRAVSSFDVMDQILQWFDSEYPNLAEIVVAGHSLGGQATHRHAAVGAVLPLRPQVKVVHYIADPSSYVWLSRSRPGPLPRSHCPGFDDWRDGLSNYPLDYSAELVAAGAGAVLARFQIRNVVFAHGLNDTGENAATCGPFTTGATRKDRMLNFIKEFPPDPEDNVDFLPGVSHNTHEVFTSEAGVQRLFLDNFDGSGWRAPDMGPRQTSFDSPDPGPRDHKHRYEILPHELCS